MEQKQVKLIGFRAENSGIIRAVELTPDLLLKRLIVIVGESGMGKSSLIRLMQTAVSGTDAILNKTVLEKGYLTEAQLLDGDIKLYVGAKVTEFKRGASAGENKFEIFLYAKDDAGNTYTPILDGVKATAGEYVKLLTTDLTFNMAAMFTNNQTEHRKLIEKLFKPELDALKADEVVEKIVQAKKHRDGCRTLCQGNGAYLERFSEEGYTEVQLNMITKPDLSPIEQSLFNKKLELDRLVNGSEDRYKLALEQQKSERTAALQTIKDAGLDLREKLRADNEIKQKAYDVAKKAHYEVLDKKQKFTEDYAVLMNKVQSLVSSSVLKTILPLLLEDQANQLAGFVTVLPTEPVADPTLTKQLQDKLDEYAKLEATPYPEIKKGEVDTTEVEKQIKSIEDQLEATKATLELYNRYQLWKNWIKAKGEYEDQVNTLRKLYAGIDVGVEGMHIVPVETDSDKVEVWIQYDGCYDTEFFHNENKESRFMFEYSSFQCSAIGVMLQAARLNLKPKALRLAIVDDVAFTSKGLAVLAKMCEDFNVQLITSRTDDYDKTNIPDGEIIVEGGEVFFNK